MKKKMLSALLFVLSAAAASAASNDTPVSAESAPPAWPRSNPEHLAFFCGSLAGDSDQTMPPGYGDMVNQILDAHQRSGLTPFEILLELKQVAKCDRAAAPRVANINADLRAQGATK